MELLARPWIIGPRCFQKTELKYLSLKRETNCLEDQDICLSNTDEGRAREHRNSCWYGVTYPFLSMLEACLKNGLLIDNI